MAVELDITKKNFEELEKFVVERYFYNKKTDIRKDPLFSTGVIDSLSVLELILKIEELFRIEFQIQHLIDDRVDTFEQIEKSVLRVSAGIRS